MSARRVVLGTANPGVLLAVSLFVLGSFVSLWFVLPAVGLVDVDLIGVGGILSTTSAVLLLGATARVVGDPNGYVDMVDWLVVRRVGVAAIAAVLTADALELRTTSGGTVRTVAFPASPAGQLVGYPRSKRAAERIESFRAAWFAAHDHAVPEASQCTVALRTSALAAAFGLAGLIFGGVVLIALT